MAPILIIFGPNQSQRCQLKFEKKLGRRKDFREGENFEKLSRKVWKSCPVFRFGRKMEMAMWSKNTSPMLSGRLTSNLNYTAQCHESFSIFDFFSKTFTKKVSIFFSFFFKQKSDFFKIFSRKKTRFFFICFSNLFLKKTSIFFSGNRRYAHNGMLRA